jgi:hypothetical protein
VPDYFDDVPAAYRTEDFLNFAEREKERIVHLDEIHKLKMTGQSPIKRPSKHQLNKLVIQWQKKKKQDYI